MVLAVANFHKLSQDELWVAFGVKKKYKLIPVHELASKLGQQKARALPFFLAITGCDTSSSFSSIGKVNT